MTELSTENLLHPRQVTELKESKEKLAGMLTAPLYIRNQLADGGAGVAKQMKDIDRMLEQAPKPIPAEEIDAAVKTEELLREGWLDGMPTQAEMRRNPPGAVDKNIAWSKKHGKGVLRWKNLRRRLHASGISEHRLADEGDVSNIEMFRPRGGVGEMNLDTAQIEGKDYRLPPPGAGQVAIMNEKDAGVLAEINPELLAAMGTLTNEQRAQVLEAVRALPEAKEPAKPPKRSSKKKEWTDEERDAFGAKMKAARAAKKEG